MIVNPEHRIKAWVGGTYRELHDHEIKLIDNDRKILKTNGKSEYVFIDNPERASSEGRIIKRRKPTNITPKKKKRR